MIGRTEISVLKETLLEQRSLLQKLQNELEAEREAASTSASEALSMILRLQGEKAELTLEASQYKRMAEEKMSHAEISLAIFEDLIYQTEMEISSLEHQIQAYRCKLLSLGYSDMEHSRTCNENWQTNDAFDDDLNEMKNTFECDYRSQTPSPESLSDSVPVEKEVIEENLDISRKGSAICVSSCQDLYEQIRKLDERVKEITDFGDCPKNHNEILGGILKSHSLLSHQETEKSGAETCENHASSSKVHDVFEVPQTNKKVIGKEEEENLTKLRKNTKIGRNRKKSSRSKSSASSNDHKADLQHLKARMERLECERSTSKREIARKNQEEDLKLLREIKEQLNSVQSEMRSLRTPNKSPSCSNDSSLLSVEEAMLYFWF